MVAGYSAPAAHATRALVAAILLAGATGGALAQTLACKPAAPRIDPGAGFVAFGASEQALARAGNPGPAWEWALGTETEGSAKTEGSADWISGRSLAWALTYSGSGSARLVVRDGSSTVLALDYPSGMDAGNALELHAAMNPGIGPGTSIHASLARLKDKPAAGALSLTGNHQPASQALYFYYPPMREGFTAQGNVMLGYATRPTGSRVAFSVRSGTLPCTNQAPTVSLAAPASGAILQAGSATTLSANAADADGTLAQVEFFANGAPIGKAIAAPFQAQWTPQAGRYTLTAVATDNAGDATASSQVTIVANAQPTVSITAPASATILQLPGAVTLTASAADSDGTVSKVDFYQGATLLGTTTAAPYSFSIESLSPGTYSFTAIAADERGGTASSAPVSVVVNAPPTVTLISLAGNATFKAPANIALSASATDGDGTVSSVAFYYNGETLITTLSAAPYTFTWTGIPQGTYTVTARVTDNTGYTVSSEPLALTVTAGAAKLYFIGVDHLNTPRLVTDEQQRVVWRWDQQEPFGDNVVDENPSRLGAFELPLRFPGQYFDKEIGLQHNVFRDYESSAGRYIEQDPIGLSGGLNVYAYVGGNPISYTDPTGLETYQCKRPLGDLPGSDKRNGLDIWGNPFYHQYSCTRDPDTGKLVCGGQGFAGSWVSSKGKPTTAQTDYYVASACDQTMGDNKCFERCLIDEWKKPRPHYGIPFGTDCQEYDDDVNRRCRKKCGLK